jgi:phospholipid transport system substrate-binding protein
MKSPYWLLAAVLLTGGVQAVPHYGPGPAPYMGGPASTPRAGNPAVALRAGMDKLLAFLGSEENSSPEALAQFLNTEIAPFFDFDYMARSAGGRLFEGLSEDEQRAMVEDLKRTFLTKMAEKLSAYDRQQVRFMPPRSGNDGRTAQVSVAILNPGSYPSRLDFRLYRAGHQWHVFDVSANGQSAIVHYRRQLMRQAQERQMREMRPAGPMMAPQMRSNAPNRCFDKTVFLNGRAYTRTICP